MKKRFDLTTIGGRLSESIKIASKKRRDVAMYIGVCASQIEAWEKNEETPSFDELERICEYIAGDPNWILTGIHPNTPRL
jgi:transcriptional regulator with XRE-family HTH domain